MVTIVICYRKGTGDILAANLASLARHTKDVPYKVVVQVVKGDIDDDLKSLMAFYTLSVNEVECQSAVTRIHGALLDAYIPSEVKTEFVMSLDSDCFPVADGWLADLLAMMDKGAKVTGILHPWAPPPADMNKKRIEWRVRSQHCWENTHVACQMIRTADIVTLGKKFVTGDDTGLDIVKAARANGWGIDGFRVTRCPKPETSNIDPEFNRYVSLVYGDKMFHLGGFTRVAVCGDQPVFGAEFGWVGPRVVKEKGAEFLLDDSLSYRFKFDREDAIAKEKMDRIFGMRNR